MEEKNLKSWVEYRDVIAELREKYGYHDLSLDDGSSYKQDNLILFRGQQNKEWKLETTLERKTKKSYSVQQYLIDATGLAPQLEIFTGKKWPIPDRDAVLRTIHENKNEAFAYFPYFDYLVYLRHHGYPSPLLDWSKSPYVAAYFSMAEASPNSDIAIFVYVERVDYTKYQMIGAPAITVHDRLIGADKRHFMQQACYTTATKWIQDKSTHYFCSHHDVFDQVTEDGQDLLIKITIPSSERKAALADLYDHNINHFTLFQSEDALLKTLTLKNFDLRDNDFSYKLT